VTAPEHFFCRVKTGTLHGVRAGKGTPLVLLHGNGQSWHEFAPVLPALSGRFDVVAFDMPGHGDSIASDTRLSIEAFAGAISEGMRELDIARAIVAGSSIGAFIAAVLAAKHAALVAGAIFAEAQLRTPAWWAAAWPVVEQLFAIPTQSREQVEARHVAPVSDAELIRWNIDRNKAGTWSMLNAMWAIREHDLAASLAAVKTPALLMFGAKGPALETADALYAAIPRAGRAVIADAGHFLVADQPDAFVRHILEFAA